MTLFDYFYSLYIFMRPTFINIAGVICAMDGRCVRRVCSGYSDQLKRLSDCGDLLETIIRVVGFEAFRPALEKQLAYDDDTKGCRSPYDRKRGDFLRPRCRGSLAQGRLDHLLVATAGLLRGQHIERTQIYVKSQRPRLGGLKHLFSVLPAGSGEPNFCANR